MVSVWFWYYVGLDLVWCGYCFAMVLVLFCSCLSIALICFAPVSVWLGIVLDGLIRLGMVLVWC